ncbi:hypothetical protein SERLA73DRAFT_157457 [Serpula lacrymans var. lacrymans S7.3]|uniref:Retrotransposon gag domain-containing protein n=1 Tax=Serpula lacrymans var. lacrymans (strain S7.3) TaxID=936435 RepID=F8QJ44_SERL3|nr:hypothetical protein SERLA73DRAFT_157457 [Serpula lacrymans var. lacrymans S7.3]
MDILHRIAAAYWAGLQIRGIILWSIECTIESWAHFESMLKEHFQDVFERAKYKIMYFKQGTLTAQKYFVKFGATQRCAGYNIRRHKQFLITLIRNNINGPLIKQIIYLGNIPKTYMEWKTRIVMNDQLWRDQVENKKMMKGIAGGSSGSGTRDPTAAKDTANLKLKEAIKEENLKGKQAENIPKVAVHKCWHLHNLSKQLCVTCSHYLASKSVVSTQESHPCPDKYPVEVLWHFDNCKKDEDETVKKLLSIHVSNSVEGHPPGDRVAAAAANSVLKPLEGRARPWPGVEVQNRNGNRASKEVSSKVKCLENGEETTTCDQCCFRGHPLRHWDGSGSLSSADKYLSNILDLLWAAWKTAKGPISKGKALSDLSLFSTLCWTVLIISSTTSASMAPPSSISTVSALTVLASVAASVLSISQVTAGDSDSPNEEECCAEFQTLKKNELIEWIKTSGVTVSNLKQRNKKDLVTTILALPPKK